MTDRHCKNHRVLVWKFIKANWIWESQIPTERHAWSDVKLPFLIDQEDTSLPGGTCLPLKLLFYFLAQIQLWTLKKKRPWRGVFMTFLGKIVHIWNSGYAYISNILASNYTDLLITFVHEPLEVPSNLFKEGIARRSAPIPPFIPLKGPEQVSPG